jgi:hypothetical protein
MEEEKLFMKNDAELIAWFDELQMNQFVKYSKIRKSSPKEKILRDVYICSRSPLGAHGKGTGKRNRGSTKSTHLCTSRVQVDKTKNGLSITYHKTHSGHSIEPSRAIGLPTVLKKQIARELEAGIPRGEVAKKIRESGVSELARLVTTQDVTNVGRKFNISVNLNHSRNRSRSRKDRGDDDDFDYFDLHTPSPAPAFDLERINALIQEALVLVTDANSASIFENNLKSAITTLQENQIQKSKSSIPKKRPRSSTNTRKKKKLAEQTAPGVAVPPAPAPAVVAGSESDEQFIFVMGDNNTWFRM